VGRPQIVRSDKLLKRLRQLAYLVAHPLGHLRCAITVRRSRLACDPLIPFKYLGDHLSLSLRPVQRRQALAGHYAALPSLLKDSAREGLKDGILLWSRDFPGGQPLSIILEPSKLAPMEGELQIRFCFRSDLCVLTFLVMPGDIFGLSYGWILFIGGVQGRIGSRTEMREASRLNGEISPATMLVLTVQALAEVIGVDQIVAIGEDEHISLNYSPEEIKFDYGRFWKEIGGARVGSHYRIPMTSPQKPLFEIPLTHRARTKRKREAKELVRRTIARRLGEVIRPLSAPLFSWPSVAQATKASSSRPVLPA